MEKKTRRTFLLLINSGFVALFLVLWNKLTLSHLEVNNKKKLVLPFNKNKTVSFFDDFIVINEQGKTIVLSSHCTHLGCKISNHQTARLICPCHGSEYDLEGNPLKGPAYRKLKNVSFEISTDGNSIELMG